MENIARDSVQFQFPHRVWSLGRWIFDRYNLKTCIHIKSICVLVKIKYNVRLGHRETIEWIESIMFCCSSHSNYKQLLLREDSFDLEILEVWNNFHWCFVSSSLNWSISVKMPNITVHSSIIHHKNTGIE